MSLTVGELLQEQLNSGRNAHDHTPTDKPWAKSFQVITNFKVRTTRQGTVVLADFGAFLSQYEDDVMRLNEPANRPNPARVWDLITEGDARDWFGDQIIAPVLHAFT